MTIFMKCGHTANCTREGKPYCLICDCAEVDESVNEELGQMRQAKCNFCGKKTISKPTLPFFKRQPNRENDEYYCGCGGWN